MDVKEAIPKSIATINCFYFFKRLYYDKRRIMRKRYFSPKKCWISNRI